VNRTIAKAEESGFTLLELLIAIALLIVISFAIYQTTSSTYMLRDRLRGEGDFYNGIRMAMSIVDRDVSLIYTPILMLPDDPKAQGLLSGQPMSNEEYTQTLGADQGRTATTYWGEAIHRNGIRPSRFIGTDSEMTFISLSNVRVYKDSKESEFSKIKYTLEDDKLSQGNLTPTKVLMRRTTPNAFEDDEKSATDPTKFRIYPLLPGIKKLTFRYFRLDKNQWLPRWDSDNQDTKYRFPDIIEAKVEVISGTRLAFEGLYRFRPEVPLRGISPSF
jgi:prepilin-type N-terminal cleavage/methylation domain-containing protein